MNHFKIDDDVLSVFANLVLALNGKASHGNVAEICAYLLILFQSFERKSEQCTITANQSTLYK